MSEGLRSRSVNSGLQLSCNVKGVVMCKRRVSCISILCLGFFSTPATPAKNWPQFRGTDGLGSSQEKNLPITWSEAKNVAWKTAMPGYGASSPIAWEGRLYVTCYSGYVTETHKLWQADVGANVSSPGVHEDHLYWFSDHNKTAYCLSLADGEVRYAQQVVIQPYASTLLADGRLYVVTRNSSWRASPSSSNLLTTHSTIPAPSTPAPSPTTAHSSYGATKTYTALRSCTDRGL